MFAPHMPDATIDGCELLVRVNVQAKTAEEFDFWSE